MIAKIERASPVRQPAHDELVAPDLLLSVDAQILASGVGPAGNDQAPRQQRGHIAGPAALQWHLVQVHVVAFQDTFLEIGRASCRERVCSTCRSRWSRTHQKKNKNKA